MNAGRVHGGGALLSSMSERLGLRRAPKWPGIVREMGCEHAWYCSMAVGFLFSQSLGSQGLMEL
jgi:hypothetical protein